MRNRHGDNGDDDEKDALNQTGRDGKSEQNSNDENSEETRRKRKRFDDFDDSYWAKHEKGWEKFFSKGIENNGQRIEVNNDEKSKFYNVDKVERHARLKELYCMNEEKDNATTRGINDERHETECGGKGKAYCYKDGFLSTSNYSECIFIINVNPDGGDSIQSELNGKYSLIKKSVLLPCSQSNTSLVNGKTSQRKLGNQGIRLATDDHEKDWSRLQFGYWKDQALTEALSSKWILQTLRECIDKNLKIEEKCSKYLEISAGFNIFITASSFVIGVETEERQSAQIVKQQKACDSVNTSDSGPENGKGEARTKEGHKDAIRLTLASLNARSKKGRIKNDNEQEGK